MCRPGAMSAQLAQRLLCAQHTLLPKSTVSWFETQPSTWEVSWGWGRRGTGWRRLIGCLKLQIIFCNRATNYRALLRKMTYKDKASYGSSLPCCEDVLFQTGKQRQGKKRLVSGWQSEARHMVHDAMISIQKNISVSKYVCLRICVDLEHLEETSEWWAKWSASHGAWRDDIDTWCTTQWYQIYVLD